MAVSTRWLRSRPPGYVVQLRKKNPPGFIGDYDTDVERAPVEEEQDGEHEREEEDRTGGQE